MSSSSGRSAMTGYGGGGTPRNVSVMSNQLTAYSKNTITISPQTKSVYTPADTITFRLPQNALLDLHTATLRFDVQYTNYSGSGGSYGDGSGAKTIIAAPPRYTQAFFRRVDVQMGSTSVGMTGCSDYGMVASTVNNNCNATYKTENDLNWQEAGGEIPFDNQGSAARAITAPVPTQILRSKYMLSAPAKNASSATASTTPKIPTTRTDTYLKRNWMGIMGGQYFRLLDTNLLPDVVISFQIAQKEVIQTSDIGVVDWQMKNISLRFESLNFGNGTYRRMMDMKMASGNPVTYPFTNWYTFEGALTSNTSTQVQFTVAGRSINGVMATIRPGNYDKRVTTGDTTYGNTMIQTAANPTLSPGSYYYQAFNGKDVGTWADSDQIVEYFPKTDGPDPASTVQTATWIPSFWEGDRSLSPSYSFTIDSKLYPQFYADVSDCSMLVKNYFDFGANNLNAATTVRTLRNWLNHAFVFAIGLDHHCNVAENDNLISGIDTRNSQIPITLTINNLPPILTGDMAVQNKNPVRLLAARPFVMVQMTSQLIVGAGRGVTTQN